MSDFLFKKNKRNKAVELFNFIKDYYLKFDIKKIKYCSVKVDDETKDFIVELGFRFENIMSKEINGKDLNIYSCFI